MRACRPEGHKRKKEDERKGGERMENQELKAATEAALRKQVELLAQDGVCCGALEDALAIIKVLVYALHELKN